MVSLVLNIQNRPSARTRNHGGVFLKRKKRIRSRGVGDKSVWQPEILWVFVFSPTMERGYPKTSRIVQWKLTHHPNHVPNDLPPRIFGSEVLGGLKTHSLSCSKKNWMATVGLSLFPPVATGRIPLTPHRFRVSTNRSRGQWARGSRTDSSRSLGRTSRSFGKMVLNSRRKPTPIG